VQSRASEHVATRSEVNSDSDDDGTEEGEDKAAFSLLPKSILASVCIFGADGNLASKKILPTLFTLWKRKLVPKDIIIFGYARDLMDSEKFRKHVFRCIYNPTEAQAERKEFLKCCHYVGGEFDDEASFSALLVAMQEQELKRFNARPSILECTEQVRMYYMAVPPFLYAKVCSCLRSRRAAVGVAPPAWRNLSSRDRARSAASCGRLAWAAPVSPLGASGASCAARPARATWR
jgi:glucose-6-phosphate 1-dehydrogenase